MKKQFLADKNGNIKSSWIWTDESVPCPHPNESIVEDGDVVLECYTEYNTFHSELLIKANERMVTRDELSVVSVNSGRIVLDNLVKQT